MRALLLAVLALGACKSGADLSPCSVTALAGADTSVNYIDCGTFLVGDPNYTDEAMAAAQACVLNALSQSTSFLLVYDALDCSDSSCTSSSVTGNVSAAWVGALETGGHVLGREYAGEGHSGDMSMRSVSVTTCAIIDATESCTPAVGLPCLTCTPLALPEVVCHS